MCIRDSIQAAGNLRGVAAFQSLAEDTTDHISRLRVYGKFAVSYTHLIRLAERRVKGLTSMVENLLKKQAEKEARLAVLEDELKEHKGCLLYTSRCV